MFRKPSVLAYSLSIIVLFSLSAYAHLHDGKHTCGHGFFNHTPGLLDVEEEFLSNNTRFLATASYPNLRIVADYSNLIKGGSAFINYIKNSLMPAVLSYYSAALGVKQPLTSPLKLPTAYTTICGFNTPHALYTGVTTDLYMMVTSLTDTSNWVAAAGPCYLSTTTKRTLIGLMQFNLDYTTATTDPMVHEKNTYLTLHEMTHALGFTGSAFNNFIDASGRTLTGQVKSVLLNGSYRTVLDVEPLTSMLRSHYGCSTLPGAFMENDGGAGTAGSHFERRHFLYEMMTSGLIYGLKLSNFTLALLEGSGWYAPNYAYGEPFFVGQGEGCNFLYEDCNSARFNPNNFAEFCSGSARGCGPDGEGGGVCDSDTRSDGCRYYVPVFDYDCENTVAVDNARFPTKEVFGRTSGSRCLQGTLSSLSQYSSQTSFCLKYKCAGSGLSTTLQVSLGSTTVTCTKEGQMKVSGYNGLLDCPDPLTYCSTIGKKYCPRNCMGRGTCVNKVCQCKSGFTGIDCGMNA